jgi:hypothetical protein
MLHPDTKLDVSSNKTNTWVAEGINRKLTKIVAGHDKNHRFPTRNEFNLISNEAIFIALAI